MLNAVEEETVRRILDENSENEFMEPLLEGAKEKSERFRELIGQIEEQEPDACANETQGKKTADYYYKQIYDESLAEKNQ